MSVQAFVHFQLGCWFFTAEIGLSTDEFEILPSPGYLLLHVNSIAVNEFKLALLVPWQANEPEIRDEVLRHGIQFYSESQLNKKKWQANHKNNHIIGVWMPGSFIGQRFGEVRKQSKKVINLACIS